MAEVTAGTNSLDLRIQNPEPGNPEDNRPYVTHNSGTNGSFTTQERQILVRDMLLAEESNINAQILVKMGCIYKYEYEGMTNIMVGMVRKVNYNEDRSVGSIEVLQCPPRGAKKDNLYVDISADGCFNLDYRYRVTDILKREMLLCCNLHMTDSGSFSKKRKTGKHGHSSYVVAKTSFVAFYESRTLSI